MMRETMRSGLLSLLFFALLIGGAPAALVGGECDMKCGKGTDPLTGEEGETCDNVEPGDVGYDLCFMVLIPVETEDGIEFEAECQLDGACNGDWSLPDSVRKGLAQS